MSKQPKVVVKENFEYTIAHFVDGLHVSTPDTEVETKVRKAIAYTLKINPNWVMSIQVQDEVVTMAIERHRSNIRFYNEVILGR